MGQELRGSLKLRGSDSFQNAPYDIRACRPSLPYIRFSIHAMIGIEVVAMEVFPVIVPISLGNLQTVNFYLVRTDGQVLLIDAGNDDDDCWEALQQMLKQIDITPAQIDAILVTHNHTDHIGLVDRIRHQTNDNKQIPVYAPAKAIPRIKRDETFFHKRYTYYETLFKQAGCGEDADERLKQLYKATFRKQKPSIKGPIIPFDPNDELFGFQIIDSAGHSPDHVLFHHKRTNTTFVGDHFLAHSPSNAIVDIENDGTPFYSLIRYEQSLKYAQSIQMKIAYAGHGEKMLDPQHVIENKLERINKKAERIVSTVTETKTAAMIARELYKERYYHPQLFSLIMSEIIGHVDRLAHLGVVEKALVNGVYTIKRK